MGAFEDSRAIYTDCKKMRGCSTPDEVLVGSEA